MTIRVGKDRRLEAEAAGAAEAVPEQAARDRAKAPSRDRWAPEQSLGGRHLAAQSKGGRLLPSLIVEQRPSTAGAAALRQAPIPTDENLVRTALEEQSGGDFGARRAKPRPRGDAQAIESEAIRQSGGVYPGRASRSRPLVVAPSVPHEPAQKPRARPMPASVQTGSSVPVEKYWAAKSRFEAVEEKHRRTQSALAEISSGWQQVATSRRASEERSKAAGQFREGFAGSAAEAELFRDRAKDAIAALNADFERVKHDYAVLLGDSRPAGGRQGSSEPGPSDPMAKLNAAQRFAARVATYNQRVDGLKSSGVLAPPFAAGYAIAAEQVNGKLDDRDLKRMDLIYRSGSLVEIGLSPRIEAASGKSGAAPPAPGIDYRTITR